jgi:hypothetical protein
MERRIRTSSLISPAASWMSVDGSLTGKISRAANFTNTAMKSRAIEPRLWAVWFEGDSRSEPYMVHEKGRSIQDNTRGVAC